MKVLRTTKCPNCGTEITGKHTKGQWNNVPSDFYGGKVKKKKDAVCDCGTEFIVFYAPDGNNFKIVDMAYKNEPAAETKQESSGDNDEHEKLVEQAKALGIKGVLENMKDSTLQKKIAEAQK